MHVTTVEDGAMRMRPVRGGVVVPPGGVVCLEPDGSATHLTLVGPKHAFGRGGDVPLTLTLSALGT
jgi:periplasmic copper chaperone A